MFRDRSAGKSVEGWRNGLKGSDEVIEVALERRPDESEKGTVTLSKMSRAERGMDRAFEPGTIGRSTFCSGQHFHSIVIVVPIQASKSCRVLKKLTAYSTGLNIPMTD
jgi:hypothetical protein